MKPRIWCHKPLTFGSVFRGVRPWFLGVHHHMHAMAPLRADGRNYGTRFKPYRTAFYRKGITTILVMQPGRGGLGTRAHRRQARKANATADHRRFVAWRAANPAGLAEL